MKYINETLLNSLKNRLKGPSFSKDPQELDAKNLNSSTSTKDLNPKFTLITCSDCRIDPIKLNLAFPRAFCIRNIGNQAFNAAGSVEYGILYLETPLVVVLGHSMCRAVMASLYRDIDLTEDVKKEIDTIKINKEENLSFNIINNIHEQVSYLLGKYRHKVSSGELSIIGSIWDLKDDFKGTNELITTVNINGELDKEKISKLLQRKI